MAMTEELAIAASDHGAGIAEQGHDGVAGRGRLPLVAADVADAEDNLRDLLLCCTVTGAIEGLQHSTRSRPLLAGQTCVRGNDTAMQRG